jgi:hypothetical protein
MRLRNSQGGGGRRSERKGGRGLAIRAKLPQAQSPQREGIEDPALRLPKYRLIWRWVTIVSVICAGFQIALDRDPTNLFCAIVCAVGTVLTAVAILRPSNMLFRPISSWIVIVFCLANLAGPLVAKTIEFEPVTYNLQVPLTTFSYAFLGQLAVIGGHWLYCQLKLLTSVRTFISRRILVPLLHFRTPSSGQLWLMGFIGFAAGAISVLSGQTEQASSVVARVIALFTPFSYAPFLIPFQFLFSERPTQSTKGNAWIVVYFFGVVLLALAQNSRGGFMLPVAAAGMCWLLGFFANRLPASYREPRKVTLVVIAGIVATPLIAGLVIAVAIARTTRGSSSPLELIQLTLESYGRNDLDTLRDPESVANWGYSELYVHNPLLSRFVNTKFHDNGFAEARQFGISDDEAFNEFEWTRLLATLPSPLISEIGLDIDKESLDKRSGGDYMYYLAEKNGMYGNKTGSILATGSVLFGDFFLPIFGLGIISIFVLSDAFSVVRRKRVGNNDAAGAPVEKLVVYFSPAVLMAVWGTLYLNPEFESVLDWIPTIFRWHPQAAIVYYVVFRLTAVVTGPKRAKAPVQSGARALAR